MAFPVSHVASDIYKGFPDNPENFNPNLEYGSVTDV
jgi:hypothetical protein